MLKSYIFWYISTSRINQRFGETCRRHLQGPRINEDRNEQETDDFACFYVILI
jgi:hypothetical protein